MKKIFQIASIFCLLGMAACSNEFDLTSEWKDIPVVYAILNSDSDVQYVRVEKAFIDPTKSALEIALIPDSLYYDDSKITVYIENVSSGQRFPMTRFDGNNEGFPRKSGVFATSPNWLYKTNASLEKTKNYRVVVERDENLPVTEATVQVPGDFLVTSPGASQKLFIGPDNDAKYQFRTEPSASRFNISIRFTYRDLDVATNAEQRDTLTWLAITDAKTLESDPTIGTTSVPGIRFYEFLNANIPPAATNHVRFLEKAWIILEGGGKELEEFALLADANAGITGAETVPFYTNVTNGYGLVLAKGVSTTDAYFWNQDMLPFLQEHPLTKNLKFF